VLTVRFSYINKQPSTRNSFLVDTFWNTKEMNMPHSGLRIFVKFAFLFIQELKKDKNKQPKWL